MRNSKVPSIFIVVIGSLNIGIAPARRLPQGTDSSLSDSPRALPYHVSVFVYPETTPSNKTHLDHIEDHSKRTDHISECGGAIIHSRFVLTVASCVYGVEPHRVVVRAGGDVVPPPDKPHHDKRIFRRVSRIVRHRDYHPRAHAHDFALLKLLGSLDFSDDETFGIVHLPYRAKDYDDKWAVLSGYEKSNSSERPTSVEQSHFKAIRAKVMHNDECEELGVYNVTYDSLCSQINRSTSNYCGNIGDPLVYENQVIGTLSFSNECNPDKPGLFTRISPYVRWIQEITVGQDIPDLIVVG